MIASERLVLTHDGSHTIYNDELNQHYHSVQGALQESVRVFVELGLAYIAQRQSKLSVLEMGFGTGLNALLTWQFAARNGLEIGYTSLEKFPIGLEEATQLNYDAVVGFEGLRVLHEAPWGQMVVLADVFGLRKVQSDLLEFETTEVYDLVYFDAFAPNIQPELWSVEVFERIAQWQPVGGVLSTYSSKGSVRRNLMAAGYEVQKHSGPGRKREVIRAIKQ